MHKLMIGLLLCLSALPLTGCNKIEEINDMTIFSGASVDYNTEQKVYDLCAEIINPPANATETEESRLLYTSGNSFASTVDSCSMLSEKSVHWSHSKNLLLGKELVSEVGLQPILNFIINNNEFRLSTDLIVWDQGAASNFFLTENTAGSGQLFLVENLIQNSKNTGTGTPTKAYEAINILQTDGIELTLPILAVNDNSLFLNGSAVFRSDRYIGQLTKEETQYLFLLQNRPCDFLITQEHSQQSYRLEKVRAELEPIISEGHLKLLVHIRGTAVVSASEKGTVPLDEAERQRLEKQIAVSCGRVITRLQKDLRSDVLGVGKIVKSEFPTVWSKQKIDWNTGGFSNMPVQISCTVKIQIGETHS